MALSIDYRSFSPEGPSSKVFNRHWWAAEAKDRPEAIASVIHTLQEAQLQITGQRNICRRLYGNSPIYGMNGLTFSKIPSQVLTIKDRITYNLCQSVVDTKTSKIAKNKPQPMFLTTRGNYKQQRRAQKLNQFMDGVFFSNRANELRPIIFRDADVLGTGAIHVYGENRQVKWERCSVDELLVDELESLYDMPRQLHRVKNVDRYVLADKFPKLRNEIMLCREALDPSAVSKPHVSDQIAVAESWHLRSGPEATDGLHTIIIDGKELFSEQYDLDFFPFAFFHSARRMEGFWGQSAVERLQNIQLEINKLLWVIQRTMHLAGSSKIWLEQGSKIVKGHLNNDIWSIGTYTGTPPMYVTPPMVQPEVYQHLATLIQRGFEQEGISMLSATSRKPEGLDSGKALRTFNDIETERFMVVGQAYEQLSLDLAKISKAVAADIHEKQGSVRIKAPSGKYIQTIDWKEVDLDEESYVLQCFPISSLPNEPAGRTATIQEWIQAGWIDPRQGRRLMDFPDLDKYESLANAMEERILYSLDQIVDEGEFIPPDSYLDPMLARELCLQYINCYSTQGLEEEKIQMLKSYLNHLDVMQAQSAPPPQPQANPEMAPTSELIPNVPTIQ